ncbi:hypothetical protein F3Q20_02510 [Salmonella enterica subsp. enterica]|nr:hypothetical protein [Salmonella enterica subsp. enterica]EHI2605522.1 hypothetical protein [Salmonella enterica]
MFINQQQRDELELAFSCTDRDYRLPVRHHHKKTDMTTSGFTREEALELATEFYRDCGYGNHNEFFKARRTSHTEFRRVMEWFDFDIKRYYRVDGGQIYRMNWIGRREMLNRWRYTDKWVGGYRNDSSTFKKGYTESRELFVEMENLRLGHYFDNAKEFHDLLRRVDIGRSTYYSRLKKYGIKREFFMSIDGGELFPLKCRSSK